MSKATNTGINVEMRDAAQDLQALLKEVRAFREYVQQSTAIFAEINQPSEAGKTSKPN